MSGSYRKGKIPKLSVLSHISPDQDDGYAYCQQIYTMKKKMNSDVSGTNVENCIYSFVIKNC